MKTFFKSEEGKSEILDLYDKKLHALGIAWESIVLNTSFGQTHFLVTGNPENPPLVVVHGSNGCAPISLFTYPHLAQRYRVWAVDVLAQPNKSEGNRLSMTDDSYGRWMVECISMLGLQEVTLAGFSFGGLIILKTLEFDESRIRQAFLAAPAYIVNGNPLMLLWNMFIPMKRFMKTGREKHLFRVLHALFSELDDFAIQYLSKVFLHFEMDFTPVPVMDAQKAGTIQTPIYLYAAKNDLLFPGVKMCKRAKKIFPSLRSAVLLENSRHVQDSRANLQIEAAILDFCPE